jgi:hypothetical protein
VIEMSEKTFRKWCDKIGGRLESTPNGKNRCYLGDSRVGYEVGEMFRVDTDGPFEVTSVGIEDTLPGRRVLFSDVELELHGGTLVAKDGEAQIRVKKI